MKRTLLFAGLLLAAWAVQACGPIEYLNTVTFNASQAVAEAKAANAEKLAPYEYWSALVYLRMAQEKASYADFQLSIKYGERAIKMGKKARKIAVEKGEEGPSAISDTQAPPEVVPRPRPMVLLRRAQGALRRGRPPATAARSQIRGAERHEEIRKLEHRSAVGFGSGRLPSRRGGVGRMRRLPDQGASPRGGRDHKERPQERGVLLRTQGAGSRRGEPQAYQ